MQEQIGQMKKMTQGDLFGSSVRTVIGADGEPWFVAKDVCDILGLDNNRRALMSLDDDEKGVTTSNTLGGSQTLNTVSESGLYALIIKSRRPEAKAFRRWITREVLPTLRKSGLYAGEGSTLPSAMMRTADYIRLRGLNASFSGFGKTVMAACRHSGMDYERPRNRRFARLFPVAMLDKAAEGKPALRGPLCQDSAFRTFTYSKEQVAM